MRLLKYGIPIQVSVTRMGDDIQVEFGVSTAGQVALAEMLASDMEKHLGETPEGVFVFTDETEEQN